MLSADILVTFTLFVNSVYGMNDLFKAILEGDENKVIDLIKPSITKTFRRIPVYSVQERNSDSGDTPLEFAIKKGRGNIAEILIKKGAKLPSGCNGNKLLYNAIDARMENVVKFILENTDVDVNKEITYPIRNTFIRMAITCKNAAIVKMICDKGADLEKIDVCNFTPLHFAISKNVGVEIIRVLLNAGANVNKTNRYLESALHFACRYPPKKDTREIMDLLLSVEGADLEAVDYYGYAPILLAASSANAECMRALLHAGVNVHSKDTSGKTILHCAASCDNENIISLVDSYGYDFESRDENGDTPFLYAAKWGNTRAMRLLGKAGSNVNAINKRNEGVFHYAIVSEKPMEMIEISLFYGADLRKCDKDCEFTPLQYAIYKNAGVEIIRVLLKAGANVNATNSFSKTALHVAARYRNIKDMREIMDLLLSVKDVNIEAVDFYGDTPIILAAVFANTECLRALLAAGANIHSRDSDGNTVVHYPASRTKEHIISLVKSYGYNFESRNENGDTPFLHATKYGDMVAMRLLGKAGSNVNAINKRKEGVFHFAVDSWKPADMVEISLFYGADVELINLKDTEVPPINLKMEDSKYSAKIGRLTRNKLLEAGLQLHTEQGMEFIKDFWPSCHEIVKSGNHQNFQDLFRKVTEVYLKSDVPVADDHDLINLLKEYELKGAFALYNILRTFYSKKGTATKLELRKFEIFDCAVMKIMEGTYLETLPMELASDILLRNNFYRWKLEAVSFHLALAFDELKISLDEVKKAMVEIIFNF